MMGKMKSKTVTIFGTSKAVEGDEDFMFAYQLGKGLAEKGFVIANGGYGGVMTASAKGAIEAGGEVIGVTCRQFKSTKANEYVSRTIVADRLEDRLAKLVELGDGYVVLAGGTGTLVELAHVWEHKNKGFDSAGKPIIIGSRNWEPLIGVMEKADSSTRESVETVYEVEGVVSVLTERLK